MGNARTAAAHDAANPRTRYERHLRRGETCRECLDWISDRSAARRGGRRTHAPGIPGKAACGRPLTGTGTGNPTCGQCIAVTQRRAVAA